MEPSKVDNAELVERLRSLTGPALAGERGAWVVGGVVRDLLLERDPGGIVDVVVEGDAVALARRVAERVGGRVVVHERFGTATVELDGGGLDVAAARRETYARPGALPDVELGATVREDLARRDFTVNAIAVSLDDASILAAPLALEDLEAHVLRVLHDESFVDDPTRLLRLARYSARLGFSAEPHTAELAAAADVSTVSASRLGAELRLLLREPLPEALVALESGGLGRAVVSPSFAARADVISRAMRFTPSPLVALAACVVGATDLGTRLDALEFTASERDTVVAATSHAPELAADLAGARSDVELWRLLRRQSPETVALAGALDPAAEPAARRWLDDVRHRTLEITGDDLVAAGVTGPPVGRGLDAAMEAALAGTAPDRESQLATALRAARA
jgi:tRNA nucleotidyltransferase (CCA-adding enzyme)